MTIRGKLKEAKVIFLVFFIVLLVALTYLHKRASIQTSSLKATRSYIQTSSLKSPRTYKHTSSLKALYDLEYNQWNKTATQSDICMKNYYKKYLLVIVYNHPHFESIEILTRFYKPVFSNILFCGPESSVTHPNVIQILSMQGYFGYDCLASAFRKEPWHEGYFYINDDIILNYWNLVVNNFDTKSIWQSGTGRVKLNEKSSKENTWYWWNTEFGLNAILKATEEIKSNPLLKTSYSTNLNNGDGVEYANWGRSDVFYIPKRYMKVYESLSKIFRRHQVFLEIAVPTILRYLSPSTNISTFPQELYIPRNLNRTALDNHYVWNAYLKNPKLWFIHPLKFYNKKKENNHYGWGLMENVFTRMTAKFSTCV